MGKNKTLLSSEKNKGTFSKNTYMVVQSSYFQYYQRGATDDIRFLKYKLYGERGRKTHNTYRLQTQIDYKHI